MPKRNRQVFTGLEIGSCSIKAVICELHDDGALSVLGSSEVPSLQKVIKAQPVDVVLIQEQLAQAMSQAEQHAKCRVGTLFLALSGAHIRCINSTGSTVIRAPDRRATVDDLQHALSIAYAYNLTPQQQVLHYELRRFRLDNGEEVENPVGHVCSRLEAEVNIIYGNSSNIQTLQTLVADVMGYAPALTIFSGIAAGRACLSPEQLQQGSFIIDIGAGISEFALLRGGNCYYAGQIAVGCDHIINDLALGLRLPPARCRKILHDLHLFGSAVMNPDGHSRIIQIETLGQKPRRIPGSTIELIIELRLAELFELILAQLRQDKVLERIHHSIMLSGGGARIYGIDRLAARIFEIPVEIASPYLCSGVETVLKSSNYLTPLGLIRQGAAMLAAEQETMAPPLVDQIRLDLRKFIQLIQRTFRW